MADPQTPTLRLTEPTVGGDSGFWGGYLNSNMAYIDQAINQVISIALTTTVTTLEAAGDSGDQARYLWYKFTGSPGANCTVIIPGCQKVGIVTNNISNYTVTVTTGSGTTLVVEPGQTFGFFCDGTNVGVLPWGSPGILNALILSSNTTLTTAYAGSYIEVAASSSFTVTLPTPVNNAGSSFIFFNSGPTPIALATPSGGFYGNGGSGTSSLTLASGNSVMMVADGTNWIVVFAGSPNAVMPYIALVGNTTLTIYQSSAFIVLSNTVTYTVTLPSPANRTGVCYTFYQGNSVAVTIATASGHIYAPGGASLGTSFSFPPGGGFFVVNDGADWFILYGSGIPGSFTKLNASGNDALKYYNGSQQGIPNGVATTITGWSVDADRLGANFNASTGIFTAPDTGEYFVSVGILSEGVVGWNVNTIWQVEIVPSAGATIAGADYVQAGNGNPLFATCSGIFALQAGQTIQVKVLQNDGTTISLNANSALNYLSIHRVP